MNLREKSPYYYEIGVQLGTLLPGSVGEEIVTTLVKALSVRYRNILDRSQPVFVVRRLTESALGSLTRCLSRLHPAQPASSPAVT